MNEIIKLSKSEKTLILSMIYMNESEGWYYGNKEKYTSLRNKLKSKLLNEVNFKANAVKPDEV